MNFHNVCADVAPGTLFLADAGSGTAQYCIKAIDKNTQRAWVAMLYPSEDEYNNKPGLLHEDLFQNRAIVTLGDAVLCPQLDDSTKVVTQGFSAEPGSLYLADDGSAWVCIASGKGSQRPFVNIRSGEFVASIKASERALVKAWLVSIPKPPDHEKLFSVSV